MEDSGPQSAPPPSGVQQTVPIETSTSSSSTQMPAISSRPTTTIPAAIPDADMDHADIGEPAAKTQRTMLPVTCEEEQYVEFEEEFEYLKAPPLPPAPFFILYCSLVLVLFFFVASWPSWGLCRASWRSRGGARRLRGPSWPGSPSWSPLGARLGPLLGPSWGPFGAPSGLQEGPWGLPGRCLAKIAHDTSSEAR